MKTIITTAKYGKKEFENEEDAKKYLKKLQGLGVWRIKVQEILECN
jgi:hypothetical protein